jgi:hypothetical protein
MNKLIRHSINPQVLMTFPISSTNRFSVAIGQMSVRNSPELVNFFSAQRLALKSAPKRKNRRLTAKQQHHRQLAYPFNAET